MNLTGNTIFITGGGSGIGRGLAEALHKLGNQVIISGRRKGHLEATTNANPGMKSVELNVEDPASIASVSKRLIGDFPKLNVLINNAGIMQPDDAAGVIDDALLTSTITTNLLGPIRLTPSVCAAGGCRPIPEGDRHDGEAHLWLIGESRPADSERCSL